MLFFHLLFNSALIMILKIDLPGGYGILFSASCLHRQHILADFFFYFLFYLTDSLFAAVNTVDLGTRVKMSAKINSDHHISDHHHCTQRQKGDPHRIKACLSFFLWLFPMKRRSGRLPVFFRISAPPPAVSALFITASAPHGTASDVLTLHQTSPMPFLFPEIFFIVSVIFSIHNKLLKNGPV